MPIDTNMLLYYLAGTGAAISEEGSAGQALGQITQQQIRTQNFAKMMGDILKGGEGKFTMDKKGFSLKGSADMLKGGDFDPLARSEEGGGTPTSISPTPAPTPTQPGMSPSVLDILNPSASPLDIANADLAGLTTEDISKALGIKVALDRTRIAETAAGIPDKTAAQKNYEFAVQQGFSGSFVDFQNIAKTTHQKDYDAAVKGGYAGTFHEWMAEMAEAGGISLSLGEYTARRAASKAVDRASFLKSPKFRIDAEKIVDKRDRLAYETSDDPEQAREKFVWSEMDKQVRTSYPDVTFGRDTKTGVIGWYNKSGGLVASWQ